MLETNLFGNLRVAQAFAQVLRTHGGGSLLNVLSLAAWLPLPTAYAVSKAAMLSATNALRIELGQQGTSVTALLVGMVDTPMSARWDMPKTSAESVVGQAYDGVAAGAAEVHADADTIDVKSRLSDSVKSLNAHLAEALSSFEL